MGQILITIVTVEIEFISVKFLPMYIKVTEIRSWHCTTPFWPNPQHDDKSNAEEGVSRQGPEIIDMEGEQDDIHE